MEKAAQGVAFFVYPYWARSLSRLSREAQEEACPNLGLAERREQNQNVLAEKHIDKIVSCYEDYLKAEPLSTEEGKVLEENEFNLNFPRYVDTIEAEEPVDILGNQARITVLKVELADNEKKMNEYLKG